MKLKMIYYRYFSVTEYLFSNLKNDERDFHPRCRSSGKIQQWLTYPALHSPQTAFFVAVQGLIVSSLGSQMVHGLHEEISCLSEYDLPSLHFTHSTVTSAVIREPHCGTMPWPSGHSGQGKHTAPLGCKIVSWFHLQLLLHATCTGNW